MSEKRSAKSPDINNICMEIIGVTDEHLEEMEEMARIQAEYCSPLKMATQGRTNKAGSYNQRVLAAFRELRAILKAGPDVV